MNKSLTTDPVKLIVRGGCLYLPTPDGEIPLLIRYDEGDCDSVPWPLSEPEHLDRLESSLFDLRETGAIDAYARCVLLPDGNSFSF